MAEFERDSKRPKLTLPDHTWPTPVQDILKNYG